MKTFIGILNLNFLLEIQCEIIILTPASVVYHMDSAPQTKPSIACVQKLNKPLFIILLQKKKHIRIKLFGIDKTNGPLTK